MGNGVGVWREWDRLAEAVVGLPNDFVLPDDPGSNAPALTFLPRGTADWWEKGSGRRWSEADPEGYERCAAQLDALAAFLRGRGVTVHRPEPLSERQERVLAELSTISMQMFVRDPMIVVGRLAVEASLRMPHRFKERFGLRPLFADLARRGARHVVVPPGVPLPPRDLPEAEGPFLEGGDVMLFGDDVLVGRGEGRFATDRAGVEWLRHLLAGDFQVHEVPLHPRVLHLDDGLAAVREGLAIVAREQFTEGLPAVLDGWEFIDVTLDEALDLLAANVLVLAPGEVIVDRRVPHLADALTRHDVTVHTLDFDAVTRFAGGFRCSHHPIHRIPD